MNTWNTDKMLPTMEEMLRPEIEVGRLVTYLESKGSDTLSLWAVERLSDDLGLPVVVTRPDPISRTADLGNAWGTAVQSAGRDPGRRAALRQMVARVARDLGEVFRLWDEDEPMGRDWQGRNWMGVEPQR